MLEEDIEKAFDEAIKIEQLQTSINNQRDLLSSIPVNVIEEELAKIGISYEKMIILNSGIKNLLELQKHGS